MKILKWATILLISLSSASSLATEREGYTQDGLAIADHMRQMDLLKDAIYAELDSPEKSLANANRLAEVRQHLHSVFPKVPTKHMGKSETEQRLELIDFQKYVVRTIYITLELEELLLIPPTSEDEKIRREAKVRELGHKLTVTVSKGHRNHREE